MPFGDYPPGYKPLKLKDGPFEALPNTPVLEVYYDGDDGIPFTPTVNESLSWICSELGVNPVRMYTGTSWQGDKALTHLDTARMRALGWEPQVSIEEAVRRTVRSFICAQ